MPNRILRPWLDSETVDKLSAKAERFFVRLMMVADDYGRFHANPRLLRSALFPLKDGIRDADMSSLLAECQNAGLVVVYQAAGKPLLEIRKFGQRINGKSKFPGPPGESRGIPGNPRRMRMRSRSRRRRRRRTRRRAFRRRRGCV